MFSLSGHLFLLICLALGLLQIQPERSIPRKAPAVQVRLKAALPPHMTKPSAPDAAASPTSDIATASTVSAAAQVAAAPPLPPAKPVPLAETAEPSLAAPVPAQPNLPATNAGPTIPPATVTGPNAAAPVDIPYYYSLRQLTEKPKVIEDDTINMTLILPGVENRNLILRLLINEQGSVDQVEIEQSTLDKDISAIVTGGFGKLRFLPGRIDGVAVKCQLRIEVSLENADKPPLQRQPVQ